MQGTIVMLMALSGLGCHHKSCDVAYVPSYYGTGACYGGCYVTEYSSVVEPSCYSGCYSTGYGCYSGCYGGCYGGGCYGGGCYGGGCYGGGCYGGGCYGGCYGGGRHGGLLSGLFHCFGGWGGSWKQGCGLFGRHMVVAMTTIMAAISAVITTRQATQTIHLRFSARACPFMRRR